jgi:ketosteroid isomerase-like protein
MPSLNENVAEFLRLLRTGQSLLAMEEFYDDEVVVFENRSLARAGRRQCVEYERGQLAAQPTPPAFKLTSFAVNTQTDRAFLEYTVRFLAPNGRPLRLEEVAVQKWHGSKIIEERFYYEGVIDEGDDTDSSADSEA